MIHQVQKLNYSLLRTQTTPDLEPQSIILITCAHTKQAWCPNSLVDLTPKVRNNGKCQRYYYNNDILPLTSLRGRGGRESWSWRRTLIYGSGRTSALVDKYWPAFTHNPSRPTMALYTRFALRSCALSHSLLAALLAAGLLAHFSLFCTSCRLPHMDWKHKTQKRFPYSFWFINETIL